MRINSLSKKIIVVVAAVTFTLVALAGLIPQKDQLPENSPLVPSEIEDSEGLSKQRQEEIIVRSLTNFSHDIDNDLLAGVQYTGYIKGAGNAIFRLHAQAQQELVAELAGQESQLFELLLFSNITSSVVTLISGEPYKIPDTGLYEIRIVFRSHIETIQAAEAENQEAVPQVFNLSLKLQ
ncbi:MAG: hypothetical protein Q4G44_01015 [Alcaligenaceae bacterium]|nr:hypothetical protein [Alcaligenaceae bacterium]